MGCRRHELQEAFFVPGPHAFRVWGYGTADRLADLLMPDYWSPTRPTMVRSVHRTTLPSGQVRSTLPPHAGWGRLAGVRILLVRQDAMRRTRSPADDLGADAQEFGRSRRVAVDRFSAQMPLLRAALSAAVDSDHLVPPQHSVAISER